MGFQNSSAKERIHQRNKLTVIKRLQKIFGVERPINYSTYSGTVDPLTKCCLEEIPLVRQGRLCFHYSSLTAPRFTSCLLKPLASTRKFEEALEEANQMYDQELLDMGSLIPAVIFYVDEQLFTYSAFGNVEDESVLVIRPHNRWRFIYGLNQFLWSMGAQVPNPNQDDN